MDAQRCRIVCAPDQILIDMLGQERHERRHQPMSRIQALVKGQVGRALVLGIGGFPEAAPVSTNVPVAQLINKRLDRITGGLCVVVVHCLGTAPDRLVHQCQRPAIDFRTLSYRYVGVQIHIIQPRIQNEEAVGVPERVNE